MTEVTDKMVDAAWAAWDRTGTMRAAIEAALAARKPVNAGELVRKLRQSATYLTVGLRTKDGDLRVDAADAIDELVKALEFYADPGTYFAIGFFPDKPCGEFSEDFSDDHGDNELRGYRPGKHARAVLTRIGVKL